MTPVAVCQHGNNSNQCSQANGCAMAAVNMKRVTGSGMTDDILWYGSGSDRKCRQPPRNNVAWRGRSVRAAATYRLLRCGRAAASCLHRAVTPRLASAARHLCQQHHAALLLSIILLSISTTQ